MNLDRFTQLLDTFGGDFSRWPETERSAAELLRDSSPAARARWNEAQKLDALFALDRTQTVDAAQRVAVTNAALRRIRGLPRRGALDWRWLFARPVGAAFAATLLAGWLAGSFLGPELAFWRAPGEPAINLLLDDDSIADLEGLL